MPAKQFLIKGITQSGKVFRPSDWAERLCGVMSAFRPQGQASRHAGHLQYSPYVVPVMVGNLKCVLVDERLEGIEPMAMEFVVSFARDNALLFEEFSAEPPTENSDDIKTSDAAPGQAPRTPVG